MLVIICKIPSHRLVIGPSSEVNTCFSKLAVSSLVLSIASRHPSNICFLMGFTSGSHWCLKISIAAVAARVLTASTLSDSPHVPLGACKSFWTLSNHKESWQDSEKPNSGSSSLATANRGTGCGPGLGRGSWCFPTEAEQIFLCPRMRLCFKFEGQSSWELVKSCLTLP